MNEQAQQEDKPEIINGIKMMKGQVYLRDKRNGTVFQYEEMLSRMGFIEQFIYGEEPAEVHMGDVVVPAALDGQAKAAAWDAQARRNLKANEVTEVADDSAKEQEQEPQTKKYTPTDKAKGYDIKADFLDKGWTKEQLLAEGYIVEVP